MIGHARRRPSRLPLLRNLLPALLASMSVLRDRWIYYSFVSLPSLFLSSSDLVPKSSAYSAFYHTVPFSKPIGTVRTSSTPTSHVRNWRRAKSFCKHGYGPCSSLTHFSVGRSSFVLGTSFPFSDLEGAYTHFFCCIALQPLRRAEWETSAQVCVGRTRSPLRPSSRVHSSHGRDSSSMSVRAMAKMSVFLLILSGGGLLS
jgi:hypothetical protein